MTDRNGAGMKLARLERVRSRRGRRSGLSKLLGEGAGPWHGARPAQVHLAVSNPAGVQQDAYSTGWPPFPVALKCHTLLSDENLPPGSSSCDQASPHECACHVHNHMPVHFLIPEAACWRRECAHC